MKRIFSLVFVALLIFSLAACGGDGITDMSSSSHVGLNESSVKDTDELSTVSTDASTETNTDENSVVSSDESSVTSSDEEFETSTDESLSAGTDENSEISTDEDSEISPDEQDPPKTDIYNPEIEHKFIATDSTRQRLVVYDLNLCDGDFQKLARDEAIVWEWNWDEDPYSKHSSGARWGLDSAKYRYSPYYERDVIIACSSSGWVGIIDYEERCVMWEDNLERGPHSVEMLPNGDLIVAVSTEYASRLVYYSFSAGVEEFVYQRPADYPHGVSWDPKNQCIWSLEYYGVVCYRIENMGTENAKMVRVEGKEATFAGGRHGGHALAPICGEPGKYWASINQNLQIFDSETLQLSKGYSRFQVLSKSQIKGICSFADGTVIEVVENGSPNFRIITREMSKGKVSDVTDVVTDVHVEGSGFYKVQVFTKKYQ